MSTSSCTSIALKPHHCHSNERTVQFPTFTRPTVVGCFSVDGARKVWLDDRRFLNFVRMSPPISPQQWSTRVRLDLNEGLAMVIRKPEHASQEKLDHILKFIVANLPRLRPRNGDPGAESQLLRADVVCFRGLLRLIMCTPYETRAGWSILASRYRGNIYLCRYETDEERAERHKNAHSEHMKRMFSFGFKFEQYLATRQRHGRPATDEPVNEAEEFCCMFEARLAGARLLYGAEMDGLAGDQRGDIDLDTVDLRTAEFAEMKVHRRSQNQRQEEQFYRHKSRNWWAQSFLTAVERIVVGERNDAGIVEQLYEWRTGDLASESKQFWSAAVCAQFLVRFLQLVRETMASTDSATTVFRFDYDASGREAPVQVHCVAESEAAEYRFLPEWYVDGLSGVERCDADRKEL